MKMTAIWNIVPYSLVDRRFGGSYCFHDEDDLPTRYCIPEGFHLQDYSQDLGVDGRMLLN
jgi:hypothetical protein